MLNWSMIIHDQDVKICQDMWGHKACQLIDLLFDLSVFCSSLYRLKYVEYRLKSCFGNGWDHGWSWSVIEYINIYLSIYIWYICIYRNIKESENATQCDSGIMWNRGSLYRSHLDGPSSRRCTTCSDHHLFSVLQKWCEKPSCKANVRRLPDRIFQEGSV